MTQIELYSDIVLHPRKYDHVVNVPSQFDAAEELFNYHADEIDSKTYQAAWDVLYKSGKYVKA